MSLWWTYYECLDCGEKFRGDVSFALHRTGPEEYRRCRPKEALVRSGLFQQTWRGVWYVPLLNADKRVMRRR